MPASCAAASVSPTAPTCGSVKITRGERPPSERSSTVAAEDRVGDEPALVLAHVRELDAAVDVADRVQPVVARHAQVVADARAACPSRSRAVSRPMPSVPGLRPTATSSSSASTRRAVVELER